MHFKDIISAIICSFSIATHEASSSGFRCVKSGLGNTRVVMLLKGKKKGSAIKTFKQVTEHCEDLLKIIIKSPQKMYTFVCRCTERRINLFSSKNAVLFAILSIKHKLIVLISNPTVWFSSQHFHQKSILAAHPFSRCTLGHHLGFSAKSRRITLNCTFQSVNFTFFLHLWSLSLF